MDILLYKHIHFRCTPTYSHYTEDHGNYTPLWRPLASTPYNHTRPTKLQSAFRYQSPSESRIGGHWGHLNTYNGGGYIADLGGNILDAYSMVKALMNSNWLDRFTRAIFFEVTVFNVNTNLFTSIKVVVEIPTSGGFYVYDFMQTYRLYDYVGPQGLIVLAAQVVWFFILVYTIVTEVRRCISGGFDHLFKFWTCYEFLNILLSISVCIVYPLKVVYTIQAVEDVHNLSGELVNTDCAHPRAVITVLYGYW